MIEKYILNEKGIPVIEKNHAKWDKFMQNLFLRRVAYTEFPKQTVIVATMFLGIDFSFGEGKPILYETLVMPDNQIHRYHTKKEALLGHKEIVKKLKNSFKLKESIIKKNGK